MGWVVVLLLVVLTGCGGPRRAAHTATVPTEPPPTTVVDPYAVPPVIDVDYINRVLAALDHVYGDAIRVLVRDRAVTPEFTALMASIYSEDQLDLTLDLAKRMVEKDLTTVAARPGDPRTSTLTLLDVGPQCVFAAVTRDLSPVSAAESRVPVPQNYIALKRAPTRGANPTPWQMAYEGFKPDGTQPRSPCVPQ